MKKIPVTVIIPVKNEEKNLPQCLSRLGDFSEVIVVDSCSTDSTPNIVKEFGFCLVDFVWNGQFPKKRNWVLRNLSLKNEWVLFLDADERITDSFKVEIVKKIDNAQYNGYWICYDDYFMGKQLKHGVRMRKLALFRKNKGEYEYIDEQSWSQLDMEIHEHPIISGNVGSISSPLIHMDYNNFEHYIAKHNAYSTWEARRYLKIEKTKMRFTLRQKIKYALLNKWSYGLCYFIYAYFIRLGILDGKIGFIFNILKMQYFFNVKCKILELSLK